MKNKIVKSEDCLYFATSRVTSFYSLFADEKYVMIIIMSLRHLMEKRLVKLFAFVIMPNHIHLILRPKGKVALEKILKKFHSYTAHEILKVLREDKHAKALILFNQVAVSDYQDRSHVIWQDCLVKHIEMVAKLILL